MAGAAGAKSKPKARKKAAPDAPAEDAEAEPAITGPDATDATVVMAVPAAAAAAVPASQAGGMARPARAAGRRVRRPTRAVHPGDRLHRSIPRQPLVIGTAFAALALLVAGVGAYVLLPSASVVVTPREQSVGPQTLSVVADTTASEPDPEAGVVPADLISVDVSAQDTFESTGVRVERTRATGRVTFQSLDTSRTNTIPKGSIVSTEGGVQFRTTQSAACRGRRWSRR